MRSDAMKKGASRTPARAMLKGAGLTDEDLARPLVAVLNTWSEVTPCNVHLRELADQVKAGAALEEEARDALIAGQSARSSVEDRINRVRDNFNLQRPARGEDLLALHEKIDRLANKVDALASALAEQGAVKTPRKKATRKKTAARKKATTRKAAPARKKPTAKNSPARKTTRKT